MTRPHCSLALLQVALLAGCAVAAPAPATPQPSMTAPHPSVTAPPTPAAPRPDFGLLVDIGIFDGPPELPPLHHTVGLSDDTLLLVVDGGETQSLHEVRWNGERWEAMARLDARLLPVEEKGPYLTTVTVGTDDGFSTEAVVLLTRVPNGPISRVEVEIDGALQDIHIEQHPLSATVFPPGTEVGDEFTAFDLGTHRLDRGIVHHD